MADNTDPKDGALRAFNTELSWLVNLLIKLNPGDVEVERIKGQMSIAKGADRELLIRECGPYLFKYQTRIVSRDEKFFLADDIEEMKKLEPTARSLVSKIRQQYAKLKQGEKDQIYERVVKLLSSYLEYLLACAQTK